MKFNKSISFKETTIDIVKTHMRQRNNDNFSEILCKLIQEGENFRKITEELQKEVWEFHKTAQQVVEKSK